MRPPSSGTRRMQFEGKVAAITGAAGGIGRELCRYFGGEGAMIAAIDRSPAVTEFAEELRASGIKAEAAVVDIGDARVVRDTFVRLEDAVGAVDILINNAGISRNPSLEKTTPEGFADDV